MDISSTAQSLVNDLLPFLPHLLGKATDKAAEAIGGELGKGALARAGELWSRLMAADASSRVTEAAEEVIESNSDEDAVASLRLQVRKLLLAHPPLAEELAGQLAASSSQNTVIVTGDRAFGAGGSLSNSTVITGSVRK